LDNDGIAEAILAETSFSGKVSELFGSDDNDDDYYCLKKLYFVSEDKSLSLIEEFNEGMYLLKSQQQFYIGDDASYLTLNGYNGVN